MSTVDVFQPSAVKNPTVVVNCNMPLGTPGQVDVFLGPNNTTRIAASNKIAFTAPAANTNSSPINLRNPEDYLVLPGRTHGVFSYEDTLVSMYRLGMSPEVEQAAQHLGFKIANSAKEKNGRDYIGDLNWEQGLKLNLSLGGRTLNPRQYVNFLEYDGNF